MRELPYTHKLQEPVKHGSEDIVELVFTRKPVAKDLRGMHLSQLDLADNIITLVGRLTGQPPSVVDSLSFGDLQDLGGVIGDFLPSGPKIGNGPAE